MNAAVSNAAKADQTTSPQEIKARTEAGKTPKNSAEPKDSTENTEVKAKLHKGKESKAEKKAKREAKARELAAVHDYTKLPKPLADIAKKILNDEDGSRIFGVLNEVAEAAVPSMRSFKVPEFAHKAFYKILWGVALAYVGARGVFAGVTAKTDCSREKLKASARVLAQDGFVTVGSSTLLIRTLNAIIDKSATAMGVPHSTVKNIAKPLLSFFAAEKWVHFADPKVSNVLSKLIPINEAKFHGAEAKADEEPEAEAPKETKADDDKVIEFEDHKTQTEKITDKAKEEKQAA